MTAPDTKSSAAQPAKKPLTAREKVKLNQVTTNDPLLGQVIGGHYEVLECIGKGGMSVVYKTRHQLINQYRAVKILLPHRDSETDFLLRFQLEATAASRMDNKHIVRVHDFVAPEASAPYLVMDYAEGTALGDEIDRLGRLPVKRSLAIFSQILDAIGHAHSRGVIHRDLKPDNVLLVHDETEGPDFVKLIDFGIAKLTAADRNQPQGLTPTGEVFGSPQYMSPEQCAGLPMDARSEIYSLGCILYEMLSGRAPLLGQSVLETLNMQAHTLATPLSKLSLNPPLTVPKSLDDIVMRCLAKKPQDRFQTIEELAQTLQKQPSFDRRQRPSSSLPGFPIAAAVPLVAAAIVLSFTIGFLVAKVATDKDVTPAATGQGSAPGESEHPEWQALYMSGQKALDAGDLATAGSKLEAALTQANSLNDGQKRSAATGIDLQSLSLIKQLKNIDLNNPSRTVVLTNDYPNHPWETKVGAVVELLHSEAKNGEDIKAYLKPTIELLEDNHKGSLTPLNDVMKLAQSRLGKNPGLPVRDKLRLALLIAGLKEEQGFIREARADLKAQAQDLAGLGAFDPLVARFYTLDSRLALEEFKKDEARAAAEKALAIYEDNAVEHTTDLLDVALLRSDIALADGDVNNSLGYATKAYNSIDQTATASERVEELQDRLLTRMAALNPAAHSANAQKQVEADLERQEAKTPKDIGHLITALECADSIDKIKGTKSNGSTRPKLWRAMALAYGSGRLALASNLMHPLLLSYDTPLTQKELLGLVSNRLMIDEKLAASGNGNDGALMEDFAYLSETLEDHSLGPARDMTKAQANLLNALKIVEGPYARNNRLFAARIYYHQARKSMEQKDTATLAQLLLVQAERELRKTNVAGADRADDQALLESLKQKVNTLDQEAERAKSQGR
ncbi:MAG: serine/threonine protein kinase [Cyanobacteria bacterium SZAS TMP-1]|nr:serine/threonine protein kinase [Cyanobacteria bacterium SZAS TMP-1]